MTTEANEDIQNNSSFVRKVRSRVSGILNSSISKLFGLPSNDAQNDLDEPRRRRLDIEDDHLQPPSKRLKLPEASETPSFNFSLNNLHNFNNFLEPVAGPSGLSQSKSSQKNTKSNRNDTEFVIASEDKDSDSGESTSGYSSMIKSNYKKTKYSNPNLNTTVSTHKELPSHSEEKKHLLHKTPISKQNDRTLFSETSLSPQGNHSSLSSRRPSFNTSTFGSPNFVDRTISTSRILNSPFYNGPTIYGGASAYARQLGTPSTSRKSKFDAIKPINWDKSTTNASLSKTARRILEGLERYNTPLTDARKIPMPSKQNNRVEGLLSKYIGANPYRVKEVKTGSNRELQIPTIPELLKQKQKLQETTEAARQIATGLKSYESEYKIKSVEEQQKHTNKMKSKITSVRMKSAPTIDIIENVCLKPVPFTLPDDKLPKFDVIVPPPTNFKLNNLENAEISETKASPESLISKNTQMLSKSENFEFKFSKPLVIAENSKTVVAINNYKFSEPVPKKKLHEKIPASGRKNGEVMQNNLFPKITDPLVEKFKPAEGTWECSVCLIRNKPEILKCCACEAHRPTEKENSKSTVLTNNNINLFQIPNKKTNEWECPTCLVRNKDILKVCIACQGSKPSTENNNFDHLIKSSSDQWECKTCWIKNSKDLNKCAACESLRISDEKFVTTPNTLNLDKFKPSSSTWECQTCLVRNKIENEKCVACETARITAIESPKKTDNKLGNLLQPQSDTWECSTCLIRNKNEIAKCIACEALRPAHLSGKNANGKWECPSCMVRNSESVEKCPCCGEVKPGVLTKKTDTVMGFNFGNVPKFNFGIPQNINDDQKATKSSLIEPVQDNKVKSQPTFTFGIQPIAKTAEVPPTDTKSPLIVKEEPAKNLPVGSSQNDQSNIKTSTDQNNSTVFKINEITKPESFTSSVSKNSNGEPPKTFSFDSSPKPAFNFGSNQNSIPSIANSQAKPAELMPACQSNSSSINGLPPKNLTENFNTTAMFANNATPKLDAGLFTFEKSSSSNNLPANTGFNSMPVNFNMPQNKPTDNFNFVSPVVTNNTPFMSGSLTNSGVENPSVKATGFNFGNPSAGQASSASFTFGTVPKDSNQESGQVFKFNASGQGNATEGFNNFSGSSKPGGFNFNNTAPSPSFNFTSTNNTNNSGFNFSTNVPKPGGFNFSTPEPTIPNFNASAKPVFNFTGGSTPSFSTNQVDTPGAAPRRIRKAVRRAR